MFIDNARLLCEKAISRVGPTASTPISTNLTWGKLQSYLKTAVCYETSGIEHLHSHLEKQKKIDTLYRTANIIRKDDDSEFFGPAVQIQPTWMEWETSARSASLFWQEDDRIKLVRLDHLFDLEQITGGYEEFDTARLKTISDITNTLITNLVRFSLVKWLEANPEHAVIHIRAHSAERRNKRGTKIIKAARSAVSVIVVDGVERRYIDGKTVWTVHAKGWHNRRHIVQPHVRHMASGKIVAVRGHERGDESVGWVKRDAVISEVRFRVDPAKIFYGETA